MSEHTWFQENLAGSIAGGLGIEESERFDRHRVACAACARLLAESQGFDQAMDQLFAEVRPAAGWEKRVLEQLRVAQPRRRAYWSKLAAVAASVAALIALGTIGAVLHGFVSAGNLTFPGTPSEYVAVGSRNSGIESGNHLRSLGEGLSTERLNEARDGEEAKEQSVLRSEATKDQVPSKKRGAIESTWAKAKDSEAPVTWGDEFAIKGQPPVSEGGPVDILQANTIEFFPPALALITRDLSRVHTSVTGGLLGDKEAKRGDVIAKTIESLAAGGTLGEPALQTLNLSQQSTDQPAKLNRGDKGGTYQGLLGLDSNQKSLNSIEDRVRVLALPPPIAGVPLERAEMLFATPPSSEAPKGVEAYYKPKLPVDNSSTISDTKASDAPRVDNTTLTDLARARESAKGAKNQPLSKEPAQPEAPPDAAPRKIIRTGEIDFEVDSFDAAVAGVTRLVNGVNGAFVTTVNSDKLPNGKVKGSMVVRLPPEKLDKFLLDVRQELAKVGELKSQRIGSQDVTKQYTDIQSRLRGARAMEERFLQIIKTGKGEIKDLIVAENALGSWRLKIEEMEGEIRYYNNQVGLSTLTIALVEKEIQAPAALVVTQRLKIQLEVDDVEKAQKAALAAVAEVKGRVTKSELKQHAAGQLEAILHFEVAPDAADKVRDRLKQLGVVTHQDADRSEQTEGAGSRNSTIKIKQNDVKFEVGMYNVANIQPREVLVIQLASLDVPTGFRKLQEAAAKAKAQVRTAQLNEQDKLNVSAQFDFDIPSADKKAIDEALAQVGVVIGRTATQAAPGEAATDRKVGYRLTLRNVAALASREKVSLGIEVKDVDQTAADILDIVKARQGHIAGSQVNHERTGQASAIVVFDVPLESKEELIRHLKAAGIVRLQTSTRNSQVPDNKLATAHFDVRITSTGPIVPSDEGIWPQIHTSLFYSFKLLSWSLMCVIVGLSVILPWLLLIWLAYRVISKWRKRPVAGSV